MADGLLLGGETPLWMEQVLANNSLQHCKYKLNHCNKFADLKFDSVPFNNVLRLTSCIRFDAWWQNKLNFYFPFMPVEKMLKTKQLCLFNPLANYNKLCICQWQKY